MADNKLTNMSAAEPLPTSCDRPAAWALLTEWTQSESLRKHALGVETCVVAYGEAKLAASDWQNPRAKSF